jgi:ribosomal protein S6--L-glutamate ligase
VSRLRVAIGEQLKKCPLVVTLGVLSQIGDYPEKELELLRTAEIIFYPTARFVELFATLGKVTFPTVNCYRLRGDRLKQVALLRMLNAPYPRTRVYYGQKQKQRILEDFTLPLIAKTPFGSEVGRSVFLIEASEELEQYNRKVNPAYIQECVTPEMELRVVVINYDRVFGSWRRLARGNYGEKSVRAGEWQREDVPSDAINLAKNIARQGGLSDVTVEMIFDGSQFLVVELNFQYDEMGDLYPGKERLETIIEMIERGEL